MTTVQLAVRLPPDLLEDLDELVVRGRFPNRASAIRAGIEAIVTRERRRQVDEAIAEAYRRTPPTPAEDAAALESLRQAIAEEPW